MATFTFDERGFLVPKKSRRQEQDEREERESLERYVTNRSVRHWWDRHDDDDDEDILSLVVGETEKQEEPEQIPFSTFRIRASDAMDIFDKTFPNRWDRDRFRASFQRHLVEHIEGWRGETALRKLTKKLHPQA